MGFHLVNWMNKEKAIAFIQQKAEALIPEKDQKQFIEAVETVAMSLHEGNIARYHLSLREYEKWHLNWK